MYKIDLIKQKLQTHKIAIGFVPLIFWLVLTGILFWVSSLGVKYGMGFDTEYFVVMIVPTTLQAGLIWLFRWRLDYGLFNISTIIKGDRWYIDYPKFAIVVLLLVLILFGGIAIIGLMLFSMPDKNLNN